MIHLVTTVWPLEPLATQKQGIKVIPSASTKKLFSPISFAELLLLLLSHISRVRLCDPIDGSPPGSPIPGILQARALEWVGDSFIHGLHLPCKSLPRLVRWTLAESTFLPKRKERCH